MIPISKNGFMPFLYTLMATGMLSIIVASCQPDNQVNMQEDGLPAVIRLEVTGEEQVDVATRTVNEDKINDLHILVYDSKGKLIGQQYNTGSSITVKTRTAKGCTIYAIANTGKPNLFNGDNDVYLENQLKKTALSLTTWDELNKGTHLPMTGSISKVDIIAGTQTVTGGMKVNRMAAKVTLNISVKANSGITIKDYAIYNIPAKSYYISSTTDAANTIWLNSGNLTSNNTTFYMFENRQGIVSSISRQQDKTHDNAPSHSTYVLINGTLHGWATTWRIYLGENETTDFNIKRNCTYKYAIKLNGKTEIDYRVTFSHAGITDLSIAGTANCYLANATNTWYKFKATVRGNGAATAAEISPTGIALPANAPIVPYKPVLVWETGGHQNVIQTITLSNDGYILFKTGSDTEGNAVIATKDKNDNIIWSWHIWKTSFDLNNMPSLIYKTNPRNFEEYETIIQRYVTMMDRNLGAARGTPPDNLGTDQETVVETFGLYYQWGRKDPFPGPAKRDGSSLINAYDINGIVHNLQSPPYQVTALDVKNAIGSDGSNEIHQYINYVIEHPLTFITIADETNFSGSWIYGSATQTDGWRASNKLWGGDLKNETSNKFLNTVYYSKTIYDPCPAGWHLPSSDTWTIFTNNTATDYKTSDTNAYNSPSGQKANVVSFMDTSIFGREFYTNDIGKGPTTFYPACGYRLAQTGIITAAGMGGYGWAAVPRAANSVGVAITDYCNYWIYPTSYTYRATGIPARCAKD